MIAQAREAQVASAADDVDFAADALADEIFVGRGDDVADEFMAEHAMESHVPFDDLQIGRADPRLADAEKRIPLTFRRLRATRVEGQRLIEDECSHEE